MLDIAPTELLLCAIVALVVIGPKDLPKAMRVLGHWVGRVRGMARHFRSGFDAMVREAEFEEMQRKWAEENARIMREHPVVPDTPEPSRADEARADAEMRPLPPPAPSPPPPADAADAAALPPRAPGQENGER
jgi:sec-independent protein translocase protein TatB